MNKILLSFFLVFVFSCNALSFGGDWSERGNGGDVIVCPSTGTHIMLDLYEARHRYGFKTTLPSIPATSFPFIVGPDELTEMAESKIETNLKILDPALKTKLIRLLKEFNVETKYLRDVELVDIEDSGAVHLPQDCLLKQLIVQKRTSVSGRKTYTISVDLWKHMRYESRLAAYLHEVIYRAAMEMNPQIKDSEKLRYFNALILSDRLTKYTKVQYQELFTQVFKRPLR